MVSLARGEVAAAFSGVSVATGRGEEEAGGTVIWSKMQLCGVQILL